MVQLRREVRPRPEHRVGRQGLSVAELAQRTDRGSALGAARRVLQWSDQIVRVDPLKRLDQRRPGLLQVRTVGGRLGQVHAQWE